MKNREFCFVVGPYKTATSLATQILEQLGYVNPAHLDNANDFAVGLSMARYFTRESSIVRELNIQLLDDLGCGLKGFSTPTKASPKNNILLDIASFLEVTPGSKVVLKDPLFCWTLRHWLHAADLVNCSPKVVFTRRRTDLLKAWQNASFTKMLLNDSDSILERIKAMSSLQKTACLHDDIPFLDTCYDELKFTTDRCI